MRGLLSSAAYHIAAWSGVLYWLLFVEHLRHVELTLLRQHDVGGNREGLAVGRQGPGIAFLELRVVHLARALDDQVIAFPMRPALYLAAGRFVDDRLAVGGVIQLGGHLALFAFLRRGHGKRHALVLDLASHGSGSRKT